MELATHYNCDMKLQAARRGEWEIVRVGKEQIEEVLEFLGTRPLVNVYLIARLIDEGPSAFGQTLAARKDGRLVCVASVTSNVVLGTASEVDPALLGEAVGELAKVISREPALIRAIICEAQLVEMLWGRIGRLLTAPTVVRLSQPIYALTALTPPLPDLVTARYAEESDLDELVPACAAMHREEVGIDPLERDPAGYRVRIRELVRQRRSIVLREGARIVFKCEFSAVTEEAVQLMGVWTAHPFRRTGLARRGLLEICGHLLRQRKVVTLFVNDFNRPAIDLYESIGFTRIGCNRALIW